MGSVCTDVKREAIFPGLDLCRKGGLHIRSLGLGVSEDLLGWTVGVYSLTRGEWPTAYISIGSLAAYSSLFLFSLIWKSWGITPPQEKLVGDYGWATKTCEIFACACCVIWETTSNQSNQKQETPFQALLERGK
ncbi:hypothetical protein L873DRAFT_1409637 [Choiromyces venosus 120613-1]|uniref:Uncharacterized protein n=1 Tax=Choiromyces venosus 120613-1 TaxID=1336337 RepID=A0A3N4J8M7_9PEZI|nr:hypothetical protein L873DRAFT_1409637 [Choiromyces venosus 120613-1]